MSKPQPLRYSTTYHIYNRGNNGETLFRQRENYLYFLELFVKHFHLHALTYTYCLMPNHFHFLVRVKSRDEIVEAYRRDDAETLRVSKTLRVSASPPSPSQAFGNLCNAYTKAVNKRFGRTGSLFENPFGRIVVDSEGYFLNLVTYIHRNPQTHGFVDDFREWPYSSYHAILLEKETRVEKTAVINWFGSREAYIDHHQTDPDESTISHLIADVHS